MDKKVEVKPIEPKYYEFRNNADFLAYLANTAMLQATKPMVDRLATQLWNKGGIEAIYDFCLNKVKYTKDPYGVEAVRLPEVIATDYFAGLDISGDCDDKTLLLASLLLNRGYKIRLIGAHYLYGGGGKNEINHVYLEYYDNNLKKWIPLDPAYARGFGIKAASVVPLQYFQPNLEFKEVGASIIDTANERALNFFYRFFNDYGEITKTDIPMLKVVKDFTDRQDMKEFLEDVIKDIDIKGSFTQDLVEKYGIERTYDLVDIMATWKHNTKIPELEKILYPEVSILPVIIGAIALFVIGVVVAKCFGASWTKAVACGLIAVAVGAVIYLACTGIAGGGVTASGCASLANGLKGVGLNNNNDTTTKNAANGIADTISTGGQIPLDNENIKDLTGEIDEKKASNATFNAINQATKIVRDLKDIGFDRANQNDVDYYKDEVEKKQQQITEQASTGKYVIPALLGGILLVSLLNVRK